MRHFLLFFFHMKSPKSGVYVKHPACLGWMPTGQLWPGPPFLLRRLHLQPLVPSLLTQHLGWADLTASGLCHWVYKAALPLPGGADSGDPLTLKLGSRVHDPFPRGSTAAPHLTNTQGRGSVDGERSLGKAGR